ncbi:unnamed protein product [Mytilus coruscus]|uniref:Uncharacterized protein n=1 Tax=Mytilus coruscus TaxID=42192 RepID=A0A6J8C379_MYTCO|nr:unnamed protein product [Mytilus coruscus]
MECLEAIEDGCFQTYKRQFIQTEPKNLSDKAVHQQATKQDCSKRGGIGVSTREGRGICTIEKSNRMITMIRYKLGEKDFGKLTLNYRTRHVLEDLGIFDKAWISDKPMEDTVEKSPSEKGKVPSIRKEKEISIASEKEDVHMNLPVSEKENTQPSKHMTASTDKSDKILKPAVESNNLQMTSSALEKEYVRPYKLKPALESNEDNMAQKRKSMEENNCEMEIDSIKSRLRSRKNVTKTQKMMQRH